jgi:phosphoribosylanthranilate isomerase
MTTSPASLWVKVCGMTTRDAVDAALAAGVDAIGFVFAPSVRRVSIERANELAEPARGRVRCVAVTLHPEPADVTAILREFAPDILQADHADLATLELPATLEVLPVLRAGAAVPVPLPVRALFEGPTSGAGQIADWSAAAAVARQAQIVLAGGLHCDNVADAVARVRPFGVDVSSGVESAPGHKSPEKIWSFVQAARAAHWSES